MEARLWTWKLVKQLNTEKIAMRISGSGLSFLKQAGHIAEGALLGSEAFGKGPRRTRLLRFTSATVNVLDRRAMLRMEMGFFTDSIVWPYLSPFIGSVSIGIPVGQEAAVPFAAWFTVQSGTINLRVQVPT